MYSLTVNSLVERDGHYFLDIHHSKGGRDRLAPILPQNVEQVKAIFEQAKKPGQQRIFERDTVYVVSQALGRNRMDTSLVHYLK